MHHPREEFLIGKEFVRIPIPECVKGQVYKIYCRNLKFGVFNGKDGFIGIREKFNTRYLFTEFHYDQGAPYGTVQGVVDYGAHVPVGIVVSSHLPDDEGNDYAPNPKLFEFLEKLEGEYERGREGQCTDLD